MSIHSNNRVARSSQRAPHSHGCAVPFTRAIVATAVLTTPAWLGFGRDGNSR